MKSKMGDCFNDYPQGAGSSGHDWRMDVQREKEARREKDRENAKPFELWQWVYNRAYKQEHWPMSVRLQDDLSSRNLTPCIPEFVALATRLIVEEKYYRQGIDEIFIDLGLGPIPLQPFEIEELAKGEK